MKIIALLVLALIGVSGCGLSGFPDRRGSDVVVYGPADHDPSLRNDAAFALRWWKQATNDTDTHLVDSCDYERACTIIVYTAGISDDETNGQTIRWSNTFNGNAGANIVIRPGLPPAAQRLTVAHEIGHAFEMFHVSDPDELMHPRMMDENLCIGWQTLTEWSALYGDNGRHTRTCIGNVSDDR